MQKLFFITLIVLLITGCSQLNPQPENEISQPTPSSPAGLPPTWTSLPALSNTPSPMKTKSSSPTPSPTITTPPEITYPLLQGDPDADQWLLILENARAVSLQQLNDGSLLFFGFYQEGNYKGVPILMRLKENGEILWQKTITGIDPQLVFSLPSGGFLLLEKDNYMVLSDQGEIQRVIEISPGQDRVGALGFEQVQSYRLHKQDETVVMDRSGIVSYFDIQGELIRQEFMAVFSGFSGWTKWLEPGKATFIRPDDKYSYGYKLWTYEYEEGVYGDYYGAERSSKKLSESVIPPIPPYFIAGNKYGHLIMGSPVEDKTTGSYGIWVTGQGGGIYPGTTSQRDFTYLNIYQRNWIIGSSVRLYNPLDGNYLRLLYERNWDLLLGDGMHQARLVGASEVPSGDLLVVGDIERTGEWGSDLFFLKLKSDELMPNCDWINHSDFGPVRTEKRGRGPGNFGNRAKSSYEKLDFSTVELNESGIQLEDVQVTFKQLCAYHNKPPTITPSPTPSSTPYPGPTWTATNTITPTQTAIPNN